ncbi:bacillithiol biosynthesis deacetylase BshB1 [Acidiluteibacter ferrifornacis]|uniref:Bacillithiol biosynthesis deacetylase BshB1 n=1 Tax=Acidiluteibacter ferrifornacis TaxID=2692424 RepID=A0A6N9NLC4_9FLAO|nr:bacillithiol biosynthesis deacetylase BshB1 [Acidiluteibacter ferrifornacis]NBG66281.1 bacillithiol biosynthesis deacetylase BshB1 [Acidiluteibacter ferrifornacis]
MKLDILAIGVHPDDVELSATGTLLKSIAQGKKVGILDLTRGELGTRGSGELRLVEAANSAKIQGIEIRENLGMADGFFQNDKAHQIEIAKIIRKYQPDVVLSNAFQDRHPDHGRACKLISDACFYSGLVKVETELDGKKQLPWRPKSIFNYIQDRYLEPDFVVDITPFVETKLKAIMAFSSQFYDPNSKEPESPISSENFIKHIKGRWANFGRLINVDYAEGFTVERPIGVDDITSLL